MNIYIMRHAQTNYNVLDLCNDDPGGGVYLTRKGIEQAEEAAKLLAFDPIDVILVSQLPRTRQTARFINNYHKVRIIEREELNDIRTGFDGISVENYISFAKNDRFNIVPPGGESLNQFRERIDFFIDSLLLESYKNVLIVTHEETMRVIVARFNRLTDQELEKLVFDNCELILFNATNQLQDIA